MVLLSEAGEESVAVVSVVSGVTVYSESPLNVYALKAVFEPPYTSQSDAQVSEAADRNPTIRDVFPTLD